MCLELRATDRVEKSESIKTDLHIVSFGLFIRFVDKKKICNIQQ